MSAFLSSLPPATLALIVGTAIVGALVRGFAGFGSALIFMPVASSLVDPRVAASAFLLVDQIAAVPLAARAAGRCDWRTVVPAVVGSSLTVWLGAAVLAMGDVLTLRWGISIVALLLLALIASGWRYRGAPTWPVSAGVGGVAGFIGGVSQISGPPVIAYWMSGPAPAATVRANLIVYFFIVSFSTAVAYWWNGIFTARTWLLLAVLLPAYMLAIWGGARLFGRASERAYRRAAFGLIAVAAITSLPVFDGIIR